ncbi:MAG: tyrosine-type recombinase/integrase [Dehalococcoidia bacterium]|nr:tyrosine-type recombinase/integrase [Dehalococcoidia bacterium]
MVVTRTKNRQWKDMEKKSTDLSALAKHFELYNRTEGKSPKTILWYNVALTQFHRFLKGAEKSTVLGELGETEVRELILYLQEKTRWQDNPYMLNHQGKLKAITIQTYIRALRGFFNWLYKEGYTNENRLARLKPPRAPIKLVDVLIQEEISKILGCINPNTATGARNYAVMMVFLDTGLRCSELTNLELKDINIEGGYLKVMGKGAKERIVPFGSSVQKVVLRYVLHFRPEPFNLTIQNLFLTLDGKPLTQNSIKMIFKRIAIMSGVKRLHPHLCRHTFATNYLIYGGDIFSLQQILGHTSLEMVRRYVTLASAQVIIQHRKFSPMDRFSLSKLGIPHTGHVVTEKRWGTGLQLRSRK